MKRDVYLEIKEELKRRRENVKYFSRAWFEMFLKCRRKNAENRENGIDDSYYTDSGLVRLVHSYDPVYASDFYMKNSGCYCEFLSLACDI